MLRCDGHDGKRRRGSRGGQMDIRSRGTSQSAMQAMCVLKANDGLKSVSMILDGDDAPRSKTARELEKL
eukprot:1032021-Pyramimonas_sp.AAC.1